MARKDIVASQVRISFDMYEYIRKEAERMGVSQNAFLNILLEQGKRLWEAQIMVRPGE